MNETFALLFAYALIIWGLSGSTGFEGGRRPSLGRKRKECEHDFKAKYVKTFKAAEICLKCYQVNYFSKESDDGK